MALRGKASNARTSGGTTVVVTVSGISIQSGDIVLVLLAGGGGTALTFSSTGFSAVPGLSNQSQASAGTQGVLYKVAGGSEPSTYTFTSSASDFLTAEVRVYSGRNTSSPFTAVAATTTVFNANSPITYALSTLTAATGDDVVLFADNHYFDGTTAATYVAPTNYANASVVYGAAQFSPILAASDRVNAPSGASSSNGGVLTVGAVTSLTYCGMTIAIAAGSSGVTGTGATAQGETASGTETETIAGTAATAEGQAATASGTETISCTAATAQGETASGTETETIAGTVATRQAETVTAAGGPGIAGSIATAQAESAAASETETIAGTVATAEGQTAAASETETIAGTVATAEGQTAAASETETIAGAIATAQAETVTAQSGAVEGVIATGEAETAAALGQQVPTKAQQRVKAAINVVLANAYALVAPDDAVVPYAVYQVVTAMPENTLGDGAPIEDFHFQIDVYDATYAAAKGNAQAIRAAMLAIPPPIGVVATLQADEFEADVRLYRQVQEFSVWQPRSTTS